MDARIAQSTLLGVGNAVTAACTEALAFVRAEARSRDPRATIYDIEQSIYALLTAALVVHVPGFESSPSHPAAIDFSSDTRDLVHSAVRAVCNDPMIRTTCSTDIPLKIGGGKDTFTQALSGLVLFIVRESLARFSPACNEGAAVFRLPPEVLSRIFVYIEWVDRLHAARVSASWASVVYNTPAVWGFVDMHELAWRDEVNSTPTWLRTVLALSAPTDLTWIANVTSRNGEEVVRGLQRHLARCVHLEVCLLEPISFKVLAGILDALHHPAPRLRRFDLIDYQDQLCPLFPRPGPLFAGQAPRLRHVRLTGNLTSPVLAGGGSFSSVDRLDLETTGHISFHGLQRAFALFPNARHLSISPEGASTSQDLAWTRVIPRELEDFIFVVDDSEVFDPIICALHRPGIARLWFWYGHDAPAEEALALLRCLVDTAPRAISNLRLDYLFDEHTETEDVNVYMWAREDAETHPMQTMLNVPVGLWHQLNAALLRGLTHLSVDETLFAAHDDFPALLQLTALTIGILPPHEQKNAGSSVFLLPRAAQTVFDLPALRTLKLAVTQLPHDEGATRLAPEVVREFVERRLRYRAPHLETLVLRGVALLENVPKEVAALLGLFEAVRVEGHRVWLVNVEPVRDMWH